MSYNITSGFRYNDSLTKEDFKNQVFEYLRDTFVVPSYIFDEFTFDDVVKIDVPIIRSKGQATINYSRTIGYDKIEQWIEKTTIKYSDGTSKVKYNPRSRKYTEWVFDSGSITGEGFASIYDDIKYEEFNGLINIDDKDKNITELTKDELEKIEIHPQVLKSSKNVILKEVFANNITYHGDHVKDETYSGDVKIIDLFAIIVSFYVLDIKIRDRSIRFFISTNGDQELRVVGEFPVEDDYQEDLKKISDLLTERDEKLKEPKKVYHTTNLIGFLLFVILLILGIVFHLVALIIVSFAPLILGYILGFKSMKEAKQIKKEYRITICDYNNEKMNQKKTIKNEGYERFINKNKQ